MSKIVRNGMMATALFALLLADQSFAAERARVSGKSTDVAIEKKFSKAADEEEAAADTRRSTMSDTQEAAKQGLLAQLLVLQTGLSRFLPLNPTDMQCFDILLLNGISPKDGWDPEKVVTRGDLARVIVLALELGSEVKNPDDPRSWMDVLASLDIQINTIGEAVERVYPLSRNRPTDPFFAPANGALGEGMDNTEVAYVLRNVYPGEFRKPVTQD